MSDADAKKIDELQASLPPWKAQFLREVRALVLQAGPGVEELWKWETPVWAHKGNLLAFGAFQNHVKLNFFQGAALTEHQQVFNAGLEAKATRGIDFAEGDVLSEAVKAVIAAAYRLNDAKKK